MANGKEKPEGTSGHKNNAYNVDKYTRRGTREIQQGGDLTKALKYFERAFVYAQKLEAAYPTRACAFNLGAVYIAAGKPEQGLEILQYAIPPGEKLDGKSNGDLFFNFALGYDSLSNTNETIKYLELALEEYQSEKGNSKMEAEVAKRLGDMYMHLREWLSGARANGLAARAFAHLGLSEDRAIVTSHEATCLLQGRRKELALPIADDCMKVCQNVRPGPNLASIYNELGLTYSQCRDFGTAVTCFELALPLCRTVSNDKSQEAVILQNLGAIYNTVGDFQRAIEFHEEAARCYAFLNNRNAQGKCFTNLAFAYSQLGDTQRAGEFYTHALQCARETHDSHAQWQAYEGLGAVAFNQGQYDVAVQYFKTALSLATNNEDSRLAQDRTVSKLTEAIHFLANRAVIEEGPVYPGHIKDHIGDGASRYPGAAVALHKHLDPGGKEDKEMVDILVNDMPRPPTRKERREQEIMALRRKDKRAFGKRPNDFKPVALGVSEYSTDDDVSLERRSYARPKSRAKRESRRIQRASSVTSSHHYATKKQTSEVDGGIFPKETLRLSRRSSSIPRNMSTGIRKRYSHSLLKVDSSDERTKANSYGNLSSTDEEDKPDDYLKRKMYPDAVQPHSQIMIKSRSLVESSLKQSLKMVGHSDQDQSQRNQECTTPTGTSLFSELTSGSERSTPIKRVVAEIVVEKHAVVTETKSEVDQQKADDNQNEQKAEVENGESGKQEEIVEIEEGLKTDISKLPPAPPIPMEQPLSGTYMPPVQVEKVDREVNEESESEEESEEEDDEEEEESDEEEEETPRPIIGNTGNNDMDDPIYQTLSTLKSVDKAEKEPAEPKPGPSHESDEGPPLPPRPSFETMTRAEKEAFLYDYQRRRDETIKKREEEETEVLPKKAKNKGSRACVVM